MFYAIDRKGNKVSARQAADEGLREVFCPVCKTELVLRNGQIKTPHFAHKSKGECDDYDNDMSPWHKRWMDVFPQYAQEAVIERPALVSMKGKRDGCFEDERIQKRRSDVCYKGYVAEFQTSPIPYETFEKKNLFYLRRGYKVIWIFDMSSFIPAGTKDGSVIDFLSFEDSKDLSTCKYTWEKPVKTFSYFCPQAEKRVFLFFSFYDMDHKDVRHGRPDLPYYLERVTWAPKAKDSEFVFWSRFATKLDIVNAQQLKKAMEDKSL